MPLLFSIKPSYCAQIYSGKKTVELRRRCTREVTPGSLMLIYETAPTKAVTGYALVTDVAELPIPALWEVARSKGSIAKDDFVSYFEGRATGYAISLQWAEKLKRVVAISEMEVSPPQSYRRIAKEHAARMLGYDASKISARYERLHSGGRLAANPRDLRNAAA